MVPESYYCKVLAVSRGKTWESKNTIALFCLMVRYRLLCFAYWSSTGRFVFGYWSRARRFVLLIGPVQNALFCLMLRFPNLKLLVPKLGTIGYHCKELPVPRGWNFSFLTSKPLDTVAKNCRFPEIGTPGSQPQNLRLPLQGTAGSQRLELLVPNLETIGYHCKETSVPRDWNSSLPTLEP